jgi:hypothetical protein
MILVRTDHPCLGVGCHRNSSKAPTYDLKGPKFEPARQDLEEFMASKENLLELSAIISRNWSIAVEEDDSYIQIYHDSKTIYCCL